MTRKPMTKTRFVAAVAQKAGLEKKQAAAVLEALNVVVVTELCNNELGEVVIPGLLKLNILSESTVLAHRDRNHSTKKPSKFQVESARSVLVAQPVKAITDFVKSSRRQELNINGDFRAEYTNLAGNPSVLPKASTGLAGNPSVLPKPTPQHTKKTSKLLVSSRSKSK